MKRAATTRPRSAPLRCPILTARAPDCRKAGKGPAFHPAARALHRSDARQGDGRARRGPPVDLCVDRRDDPGPREYVIKKDKRLWPTPLGRVVTELMIERFRDIIDVEFTANMEHQLDEVEAGKGRLEDRPARFLSGFPPRDGECRESSRRCASRCRMKRPMKSVSCAGAKWSSRAAALAGFLACPGFPECKNTKPLVERMPGRRRAAAVGCSSASRRRAMSTTPASAARSAAL